jgi:hypothetical protein
VKFNCIHRHLLRGFRLEWPTLFLHSSIGDLSTEFYFLFRIERCAAISGKNIQFEIGTRMTQIIGEKGSPRCSKPALSPIHRQTRGIGRRVNRPLTGPDLNVRKVSVDWSLLRPLAGAKSPNRHSNSRCTEIK